MRKLRAALVVGALAVVALVVPAAASAAPVDNLDQTVAATLAFSWDD